MELSKGTRVQHKTKRLSEATVYGYSKSGKRIGVLHNALKGRGVYMVVDYFDPKNIELE